MFNTFNTSNFSSVRPSTTVRSSEVLDNHEKRKKAILISRFLKEEDEKREEKRGMREDFAITCQKLYKQKKDTINLHAEIRALISKKNKMY